MRLTALPYLAYSVAERRGLLLLQIGGWSVIAKNKFYLETNMPHHLPMVTNRAYSFVVFQSAISTHRCMKLISYLIRIQSVVSFPYSIWCSISLSTQYELSFPGFLLRLLCLRGTEEEPLKSLVVSEPFTKF